MKTEEIIKTLKEKFPEESFKPVETNELAFWISAGNIYKISEFLKNEKVLDFDYLLFLTAVDMTDHLELIYYFYSYNCKHKIALKLSVERKGAEIESISSIYRTSDWHEREVYDLFGVTFKNHKDLRRILLPDDWTGHPFLKDYTHENLVHKP